jgi:methylglutaconyl-CoA hydratase
MTMPPEEPNAVDAGTVTVDVAEGIGTVRFSHPKSNSLPATLLARLAREIDDVAKNDAARVIVLRSEGTGAFCGGASFDEFKRLNDAEQGRRFFMGFAHVILAMIRAPKFVIARVHGRTAGGGVGLVAASDYAIATVDSGARLSELAVGIGPFVVGPVIEKKIGTAAFQAMAVDADWRPAAWCEQHGLYARLCDDVTALDSAVTTLATKLAASNPEAMLRLKQSFAIGTENWPALLPERAAMSGRLVLSDFTKRAIASFGAR